MSPADLATLSLLDPDQGVCPEGHRCGLDDRIGARRCVTCDYSGFALTCWEITREAIRTAERAGAEPRVVSRALAFLANRV